jgi:hypothetical protein
MGNDHPSDSKGDHPFNRNAPTPGMEISHDVCRTQNFTHHFGRDGL